MTWVVACVSFCVVLQTVLSSGYGPSSTNHVVSTDYTSRYHGPGTTPVVLPDGTLANTPEVAAARAAHLAALQKAQALWYGSSAGSDYSSYGGNGGTYSGDYSAGSHSGSYAGGKSGRVGSYVVSTDYTSRYYGPGTKPIVLPDGTLANTPEVAAARAAHLAALQKAQALWYGSKGGSSGRHSDTYSGAHSGSYSGFSSLSSDAGKVGSYGNTWPSYSGPLASAKVLPSGYLADSADVAAAKGAHLGTVAQAYADAAKWTVSNSGKAVSHGSAWQSYSGPLASATVLPSGYLADSADVAASKGSHLGAVAQAYADAAKWPAESGNQGWKQW